MACLAGREDVYEVAERFVEEALRKDGSLFTPGSAIWSAENIEDLYERFVENPNESADSFEDKFRLQLEGAPDETRQHGTFKEAQRYRGEDDSPTLGL